MLLTNKNILEIFSEHHRRQFALIVNFLKSTIFQNAIKICKNTFKSLLT